MANIGNPADVKAAIDREWAAYRRLEARLTEADTAAALDAVRANQNAGYPGYFGNPGRRLPSGYDPGRTSQTLRDERRRIERLTDRLNEACTSATLAAVEAQRAARSARWGL